MSALSKLFGLSHVLFLETPLSRQKELRKRSLLSSPIEISARTTLNIEINSISVFPHAFTSPILISFGPSFSIGMYLHLGPIHALFVRLSFSVCSEWESDEWMGVLIFNCLAFPSIVSQNGRDWIGNAARRSLKLSFTRVLNLVRVVLERTSLNFLYRFQKKEC